ncbi:MAG: deoxyhypusine synthase family protein, partial [Cyanobacteria bacterium REEB65]|nr:deoxyhypusine synthase family protein [Cyanobacteria bacterium REEB65]
VLLGEDVMLQTNAFILAVLGKLAGRTFLSSAELHHYLGECLLPLEGAKSSLLACAARLDVPIYTPSPADSLIGLQAARLALDGSSVVVDSNKDANETAAIVWGANRSAAIHLGGGAPRNFMLQTQTHLREGLGLDKGGHDYWIQITTDAGQRGGPWGPSAGEAISWGEIQPDEARHAVTVVADATIALPILAAYALDSRQPRQPSRLYRHRDELMAKLVEAYEARHVAKQEAPGENPAG